MIDVFVCGSAEVEDVFAGCIGEGKPCWLCWMEMKSGWKCSITLLGKLVWREWVNELVYA